MSSGDGRAPVDRLRSVAHPVRLDMLSLLTGASLSAAEVARELGLTHANASYHLRRLHDAGLLVVDGEEKVNGGVAKRYRHPWDAPETPSPPGRPDSESARLAEVRTLAEAVPRRFARRLKGTPSRLSDLETWVEPQVWEQVSELLQQASHLLHASARPPRTPGTIRVSATTAAFRLKEGR
ncbi:ArsR/SmtB family transcription factor [Lapillicoccus jejuensis]|nr:helix-turn-helix domain-containing protein [Lapillicoccus jejuensis]